MSYKPPKAHLLLRDSYTACGRERAAVRCTTTALVFTECSKCVAATRDGDYHVATQDQFLGDANYRDVPESDGFTRQADEDEAGRDEAERAAGRA